MRAEKQVGVSGEAFGRVILFCKRVLYLTTSHL